MGEAIENYQAMGQHRKDLRKKFGVYCPQCAIARPKAHPSILMPQQKCRVDGYRDPRPQLTDDEWMSV
jgi:hypothetical protein